jgi:hypothetical protein
MLLAPPKANDATVVLAAADLRSDWPTSRLALLGGF